MILRKPYALLIKHFKLIHVLFTIFSLFLFLRWNDLLSFFNEYIANSGFILEDYRIQELLPAYIPLLVIFLIIMNIVVAVLLKNKEKSITFYIINVLVYLILLVCLFYTSSVFSSMQTRIVDTRIIRALRDIFIALNAVQIISLGMYAFRATGFDIKKFNFTKDLIDLEIEEKDNEEVEVSVDIDVNKFTRSRRKKVRMLKYFYFENRFLCNIVLGVIGVCLLIGIAVSFINGSSSYKQFQIYNDTDYAFQVEDVYVTDTSKSGSIIEDDAMFVIVEIKAKKNSNKTVQFNVGRLELKAGNTTYHHSDRYKDYFEDFGVIYTNQELPTEYAKYFLIYRVNSSDINRKMHLNYVANRSEMVINFNYIDMSDSKNATIALKESKSLDDTILDGYTLTIDKYELNDKIQVNYRYCITSDNCISAKEYVVPTISTNYDKAVLRIDGVLNIPDEYNSYITSMTALLNRFGYLQYKIDEKIYTSKFFGVLSAQKVKQDNTVYLEVKEEVLHASSITLILQIRNQRYELVLKDGAI